MNTREEFEKLWHPICPEYDSITSSHVFDFYEACQAMNDKRIAELEEKLRAAELDAGINLMKGKK